MAAFCAVLRLPAVILAEIGACSHLGLERREALWQAAAVHDGLLSGVRYDSPSPLAEMTPLETTLADYRGTGLTTGEQLMVHRHVGMLHQ